MVETKPEPTDDNYRPSRTPTTTWRKGYIPSALIANTEFHKTISRITQIEIEQRFPPPWELWSHPFEKCDISKADAIRNPTLARRISQEKIEIIADGCPIYYTDASIALAQNRAGIGLWCPNYHLTEAWKLTRVCAPTTAELHGIERALDIISALDDRKALIISDSLSALQLSAGPAGSADSLTNRVILKQDKLIEENKTIIKLWVPSHCGILGNETADQLASKAHQSNLTIDNRALTLQESVTTLRSKHKD